MTTCLCQDLGHCSLSVLRRVETRRGRIAVFLLFAFAVLLRQPAFLLKPRFFCEEGTVYYAYALHHPILDSLLRTAQGYYSLVQNVSALLAAYCVPVEWAPLVTTLVGAAIQLLPYAIILWSRASFWQRDYAKFLGCLAVLTTALSNDIWLTSVCVHFHLSLVTGLLLLEEVDTHSRWRVAMYGWLLLVAGLTSPVSGFLTPLYILKAWWARNRASLVQALILAGTTVIQLIVVIGSADVLRGRARAELDYPTFIAIWFNKSFVLPVAGARIASWMAFDVLKPIRDFWPRLFPSYSLILGAILVLFLALVSYRQQSHRMVYLLGGYALLLAISIVTSTMGEEKFCLVYPYHHNRYFYAPSVLLVLALLNGCYGGVGRPQWQRLFCTGCICMAVATGTWGLKTMHSYNPEWPDWREECAKWRQDPTYEPKTWPPEWRVDLAGKKRREE